MSEPTSYEKFKALAKKIVTTPKADVEKRVSVDRQRRKRQKSTKQSGS